MAGNGRLVVVSPSSSHKVLITANIRRWSLLNPCGQGNKVEGCKTKGNTILQGVARETTRCECANTDSIYAALATSFMARPTSNSLDQLGGHYIMLSDPLVIGESK